MKRAAMVCLVLLVSLSVTAQTFDINPPVVSEYPKAPYIVVYDRIEVNLLEDGSHELREHDAVRVQNAQGINRFKVLSRPFDSRICRVEVNRARVHRPGQPAVLVGPQDIHEEALAPDVPAYAHLRVMRIDFGDIGPGTVVEFDIKTRYNPGRPVWEASYMQDADPLLNTTLRVSYPVGRTLFARGFGSMAKTAPTRERTPDKKSELWTWHVDRPPLLNEEPAMPQQVQGQVQVTSSRNWDDVASVLHAEWQAVFDTTDVPQPSPPPGGTLRQRLEALARFAAEQKKTLASSLSPTDSPPLTLSQCMASPQLTSTDRAVFLLGVLRKAGIEAVPAIMVPWTAGERDPQFATGRPLQSVVVAVPHEGGYIYIDPSPTAPPAGVLPPHLQGREGLLLDGPKAHWVVAPAATPAENREAVRLEARVDADGSMETLAQVEALGGPASLWRTMVEESGLDQESALFGLLVRQAGLASTLRSYRTMARGTQEGRFRAEFAWEVGEAFGPEDGATRLELPFLPLRRLDVVLSPDKPREWPVVLQHPLEEEKQLHLVLPPPLVAELTTQRIEKSNRIGRYDWMARVEGQELWALSRLTLRVAKVDTADVPQLVELLEARRAAESQRLPLSRRP